MNKMKIYIVISATILILIILGIVIGYTNSETYQMNRQLELAEEYLDEMDYEQAVAIYIQVLEIAPNNEKVLQSVEKCIDLLYGAAEEMIAFGEYDTASELAAFIYQLEADNIWGDLIFADIAYDKGELQEASILYQNILSKDSENKKALEGEARCKEQLAEKVRGKTEEKVISEPKIEKGEENTKDSTNENAEDDTKENTEEDTEKNVEEDDDKDTDTDWEEYDDMCDTEIAYREGELDEAVMAFVKDVDWRELSEAEKMFLDEAFASGTNGKIATTSSVIPYYVTPKGEWWDPSIDINIYNDKNNQPQYVWMQVCQGDPDEDLRFTHYLMKYGIFQEWLANYETWVLANDPDYNHFYVEALHQAGVYRADGNYYFSE